MRRSGGRGSHRTPVNRGRVAAARALVASEAGDSLEDVLAELAPQGSDRGLAWFIALGVMRRRGQLDGTLQQFLKQPLGQLDPGVRAVLRAGAFELLFARTPRHAAVSQAVELTRPLQVGRARGLVNAVLRRVEQVPELERAQALDHPDWLVRRWDQRYGIEATTALCERNGENPALCVVLRDPASIDALRGAWEEQGVEATSAQIGGETLPGAWVLTGHTGLVTDLAGFEGGEWWVQDPAAIAVADLCEVSAGQTVLDACAAPGGKTLRLAAAGATVDATDRSAPRLVLLRENLGRCGLEAQVRKVDWESPPPGASQYDAVLLDAPCSALGTVRRNPEVRWRRQPQDLPAMGTLQSQLLETLSQKVKPGGALVYAVCSPEPEEGEQVIARFVAAHPDWTVARTLATFPDEDADGFYAARLEAP